jgi:hypothetical protein
VISLRFFNLGPPASEAKIEGQEFLFDASEVVRLPGGELVARYGGNAWLVDGRAFLRVEIRQPVACAFRHDGATEALGVFDHVVAVGGVLIVDGRTVALLKHRQWAEVGRERAWPLLHIGPPS